ncbi:MAG: energy-coupling factor ABC transporter ATP-binding protein [Planctomycetes bacterium]|nr:energy-coupling factor ABC transporter ATP-binding protein [Planctomycetota bacterium]
MPGSIRIEQLSFTYPSQTEPTLRDVDLSVEPGEFVLLTGPTGCGKTTLLKCLNGIIPHESAGSMTGTVVINGVDSRAVSHAELCEQVGLVFQNPDDQLFSSVVEDEVAFGLENLHKGRGEIEAGIREALDWVGLTGLRQATPSNLSGGQKQRVAIAAMCAMRPSILALDEPISQLDPRGSQEILKVLRDLNREHGITVVLIEHRIRDVAGLCDRIVIMDQGGIALDRPIAEAFSDLEPFVRLGLRAPETLSICSSLGLPDRPLATGQTAEALRASIPAEVPGLPPSSGSPGEESEAAVIFRDVTFAYEKNGPAIIDAMNLTLSAGERVAFMGPNGSGKSTALSLMAALIRPTSGGVEVLGRKTDSIKAYDLAGQVGMVFQNPDLMLLAESVAAEVQFGPRNLKLPDTECARRAGAALASMTIESLADQMPLSLSRGQRLRTAVAAVLSMGPRLFLLDEPTTGQDRVHIEKMMDTLCRDCETTVVFCTHDVETVARYASRVVVLVEGRVIGDGPPLTIFRDSEILEQASLTPPDVLVLSEKLGLPPCLTVETFLRLVRKEGRDA